MAAGERSPEYDGGIDCSRLNCVSNKTRSSLVPMKKCIPRPVLRSTVNYQNKTIDAKLCRSADFTSAKGH